MAGSGLPTSIDERLFDAGDTPGRLVKKFSTALSPAVFRNFEVPAERAPDIARLHTSLQRLGRRMATEIGEHMIDKHRAAPNRAELLVDQLLELCKTHWSTVARAGSADTSGTAAYRHNIRHRRNPPIRCAVNRPRLRCR